MQVWKLLKRAEILKKFYSYFKAFPIQALRFFGYPD